MINVFSTTDPFATNLAGPYTNEYIKSNDKKISIISKTLTTQKGNASLEKYQLENR